MREAARHTETCTFASARYTARFVSFDFLSLVSVSDLTVIFLLFVPLDYRWYYTMVTSVHTCECVDVLQFLGAPGQAFDWWAAALTLTALVGAGCYHRLDGFAYRFVPNKKVRIACCTFRIR